VLLYKYLHPDRFEDVISKRRLRFTPPALLNDPFEALPWISALAPDRETLIRCVARTLEGCSPEERAHMQVPRPLLRLGSSAIEEWLVAHPGECDALLKTWDVEGQLLEELRRSIIETANTIGIFSMSADAANLLMWAHYAADHSGFVLELDSTHSFFRAQANREDILDMCRCPQPVSYSDERPEADLESLTEQQLFLTKGSAWRYEQEWRFARGLGDATDFRGGVHLFEYPAECLVGVILGARMTGPPLERALHLLRSQEEFSHVRIRKCLLSPSRYNLVVTDLIFDASDIAKF
jgi:hypothetical protein